MDVQTPAAPAGIALSHDGFQAELTQEAGLARHLWASFRGTLPTTALVAAGFSTPLVLAHLAGLDATALGMGTGLIGGLVTIVWTASAVQWFRDWEPTPPSLQLTSTTVVLGDHSTPLADIATVDDRRGRLRLLDDHGRKLRTFRVHDPVLRTWVKTAIADRARAIREPPTDDDLEASEQLDRLRRRVSESDQPLENA